MRPVLSRLRIVAPAVATVLLVSPVLWLTLKNVVALGTAYLDPSNTCWIPQDEKFLFPAEGAAVLLVLTSAVWGPFWLLTLSMSLCKRWIGWRTVVGLLVAIGLSIQWLVLDTGWLDRQYGDIWRSECL